MKFAAATIFILLLLTQTFSKWLIVIDYAINKEYIAKNLCENKSKPLLHCNGKCQMAKKIAAEENQNNKQSSGVSFAKASFSEVIVNNILEITPEPVYSTSTNLKVIYIFNLPSPLPSSIFHPPLV
jgi:hypothetical protein